MDLLRTKLYSERYGFDIQVGSEYGMGSIFSLEFPVSMLSLESENQSERESNEGRTK